MINKDVEECKLTTYNISVQSKNQNNSQNLIAINVFRKIYVNLSQCKISQSNPTLTPEGQ